MAAPRRIVPGARYLITRRCCQRTFRLRPSPDTTHALAYCLALALEKTGVILHAACFMSNHHHLVVTDPRGELPNFLRELHRFAAKALNAIQGQRENLWSAEPCSAVRLADDFDVVDKIAYVAANPVAAGLVAQPEEWPGLSIWRPGSVRVARPRGYFLHSNCPNVVTLRVDAPAPDGTLGVEAPPRSDWRKRIREAIASKVASAHRNTRAAGRHFFGRAGVLTRSFVQRARSFEPQRMIAPTVAAKDHNARRALLGLHKAFRIAYRHALDAWTAGDRSAVFPAGTWWMRVHHDVACDSEPLTG